MKDFMKTITSAIKCWTTAKIKNSTADWNEKDVNKDSYIKNKPDVALRKEVDAIQNAIDYKMNNSNPVGTGSFSMNRLPNSEIGDYSHAEGNHTIASGNSSHAEGNYTEASGNYSHAEGYSTVASGNSSHAEGNYTEASGNISHAEGNYTEAIGDAAHAEGSVTSAGGDAAHTEGQNTIASGDYQHVQGKYNIDDVDADGNPLNNYAHIVGNGVSNNKRSNAHTLDWEGNAWYQGDVYVGSTSGTNKDEGSKKLASEDYVNQCVNNIDSNTMIVNVTLDGSTYSADKTGIEIKAAIDEGKFVCAVYNKEIYYVTHCKDTNIHFQYQKVDMTGVTSKLLSCVISSNRWAYGDGNFNYGSITEVRTSSTLTTTNKTLVGAINELDSELDSHTHDDRYYTETEIDTKLSAVNTSITNITSGTTPVKEATHSSTADTATNATNAGKADLATKAEQDGNGNVIVETYETKSDALAKLAEVIALKPDWNQNDETASDYVKNRPFYDGRKIEEYIYQWDGNVDGKETIVLYDAVYAKVSDDVFPVSVNEDDYVDRQFLINFVETGELQATSSGYILEIVEGKLYFFETEFTAAIVALDNVEYEGVSYSKGVYLVSDMWGVYPSKFRVVIETGELKKLDLKYLPNITEINLVEADKYILINDEKFNSETDYKFESSGKSYDFMLCSEKLLNTLRCCVHNVVFVGINAMHYRPSSYINSPELYSFNTNSTAFETVTFSLYRD